MKRLLLPALAAALLSTSACNTAEKSSGTTDAQTATGNAGDNAMNSATSGDASTTTMPANASDPANQPAAAGTAGMDAANPSGGKMDHSTMTDSNAGTMAGKADPMGPTGPHKDDPEFMKTAAHSDQNEIQQSKMALAKGVTGMAKDMANKMIADHTKSTADLKVIATKKGVTLPTDMDAEHKAMAPTMAKLSGKAFEAKYMAQMVADHQKTANTMAAHEKMTQDPDLKGFIAKTLPVVEQHLQMGQKGATTKM